MPASICWKSWKKADHWCWMAYDWQASSGKNFHGRRRESSFNIKKMASAICQKKRDEVRRETFQLKKDKKVFIEADEIWTYVGSKENDIWIWLALERRTGLVVGCHVGKRDDAGASAPWGSLSEDCKKNGIFFTDGLSSYGKAFPAGRHRVAVKGSGKTSHIERLNLTFRQRLSALVRKTLSFSRSIENLTASAWRLVNHYNNCILSY